MEIFFNELCISEYELIDYNGFDGLKSLSKIFADAGIKICRISNDCYRLLISNAQRINRNDRNFINYLYSFFQVPYESSDVEKKQDDFLDNDWNLQGECCFGLALAYIMDTFSLSIGKGIWKQNLINITRNEETVTVRNVYDEDNWKYHIDWFHGTQPVELVECHTNPEDKRIKLRDDHGKDVLNAFCKRLVNSKYVIEIINSIEYHSHNRRFIHKVKGNGIIEIVLPWTDEGLGFSLQTTGRNMRETNKIAEILKAKYGRI